LSRRERTARQGVWALLAAAAVIGAGTLAIKEAFKRGSDPESLLVVRFAIAGALSVPMLVWSASRLTKPIPYGPIALAAASGVALFFGARGELEGLARLPAAVLILLLFVAPVWVAIIEWLAWGVRPTLASGCAVGVVLSGIVLMAGPFGTRLDPVGVLGGLVASLAFATFLIVIKRTEPRISPRLAVSVAIVASGLVGLAWRPSEMEQLGRASLLPYEVMAGAAVWLWAVLAVIGLSRTSAVTAATVSAAEPVFVAVLAYFVLGERLSLRQLLGGALVIVGIVLAARASIADQPAYEAARRST
jgi:drug/metabolite transporter (DMT)-like permease